MKKILMTLLMCLILLSLTAQAETNKNSGENDERIFLAIIIDTSPTSPSTWKQIRMLAREAVSALQPGDRLQIWRARAGQPRLQINSIIESWDIGDRASIYECIKGIKQTFLFKADVAKAVAAATPHLNRYYDNYKCCLLVLSDGKLSDGQINQIRRFADICRTQNITLRFTATKQGNRHLFIAGSQYEFEVAMLDNIYTDVWLAVVRDYRGTETTDESETIEPLPPVSTESSMSSESEEPASPLGPTTEDEEDEETDSVHDVPEMDAEPLTQHPNQIEPIAEPEKTSQQTERASESDSKRNWFLLFVGGGIIAILLLALFVYGIKNAVAARKTYRQ